MWKVFSVFLTVIGVLVYGLISFWYAVLLRLSKKKLYVVYQMGKVSSSSILATMKENRIKCVQVHYLQISNIIRLFYECVQMRQMPHIHIFNSFVVNWLRIFRTPRLAWITAFRPVGPRNVSAFFQNINNPNNSGKWEMFLTAYDHAIPERWLTGEFYKTLRLRHADFCELLSTRITAPKLLVLYTQWNDAEKVALLSSFVDKKQMTRMVNTNMASQKTYRQQYAAVLKQAADNNYEKTAEAYNPKVTEVNEILDRKRKGF